MIQAAASGAWHRSLAISVAGGERHEMAQAAVQHGPLELLLWYGDLARVKLFVDITAAK